MEFNGGHYEGEILDGYAHGEGIFRKEGDFPGTWTGTFRKNLFHGFCEYLNAILLIDFFRLCCSKRWKYARR